MDDWRTEEYLLDEQFELEHQLEFLEEKIGKLEDEYSLIQAELIRIKSELKQTRNKSNG